MAEGSSGRSFPLSVVISAVDKITGPMKKVAGSLAGAGSSLKNLNERSGLPVLTAAIGGAGDAAKGLGQRVGSVLGLVGKVTAAVGLSTAGITAFASAYADATGAIGDLAEQTGASRERLQELGYAAQMAGSSSEAMGGALKKMNLTIANLKGGSKELKTMFDGLDISLKNTNGSAKSTDEIFDTVVNRISRIKDPALQAKAAVTIFGESATELLPLLRGGNKGIAEMAAEARRLGVVMSEDAVQDGEAFGDVLDKLKLSFTGVTNTIGSTIIPTLSRLGEQLTEIFITYRPVIEKFAKQFADNLPRYVDETITAFGQLWTALKPIGSAIISLASNFGTIKTAMYTFAGLVAAYLVPGLVALATSLYTVGAAMLATPIGLFIAGIAAIAAGVYLIYKNWDQFASFFTERFDAVKKAFKTGIIDGIVELWNQFNPASLIIDSVSSVVKYLTGIDLKSIVGGLVSGLTGFSKEDKSAAPQEDPEQTKRPLRDLTKINPLKDFKTVKVGEKEDRPSPLNEFRQGPNPDRKAMPEGGPVASGMKEAKASITVDFKNMPQGAQVQSESNGAAKVKTNQGYSMMPMANQ